MRVRTSSVETCGKGLSASRQMNCFLGKLTNDTAGAKMNRGVTVLVLFVSLLNFELVLFSFFFL